MTGVTYKDKDPSFDYVAKVLNPTVLNPSMIKNPRLAMATLCMEACFLEAEGNLKEVRPYAARIIEQLAIRLMGTDWTEAWLRNFRDNPISFGEPPKEFDSSQSKSNPGEGNVWLGRCFKLVHAVDDGQMISYYRINNIGIWYHGLLVEYRPASGSVSFNPKELMLPDWLAEQAQELSSTDFDAEIEPLFNQVFSCGMK